MKPYIHQMMVRQDHFLISEEITNSELSEETILEKNTKTNITGSMKIDDFTNLLVILGLAKEASARPLT